MMKIKLPEKKGFFINRNPTLIINNQGVYEILDMPQTIEMKSGNHIVFMNLVVNSKKIDYDFKGNKNYEIDYNLNVFAGVVIFLVFFTMILCISYIFDNSIISRLFNFGLLFTVVPLLMNYALYFKAKKIIREV